MEILKNILPWIQVILAILLIVVILLQQKGSGGLGGIFGGGDGGGSYHTRRGFEQTLFRATIIIGVLFVVFAFVALLI